MDMENLQGFLTKRTCFKSCIELLFARQLKDFAAHVDEQQ